MSEKRDPVQTPEVDDDDARLHQLGYAQELRRSLSAFSNFAVSFTIISILSGCLTLYGTGMNTGGPVAMIWGWPLVGLFVVLIGLGMAEVCSSYPTAGGLYYWAAKLAPRNGAAWSWFTGWFNLIGQVAVTAGIDFGAATFLNAFLDLVGGFAATPAHTIMLLAIILVAHGLLNTFGVRIVAVLNNVSVWWHLVGVLVIVGVLIIIPAHHQSAGFVFGHFVNNTGWTSVIYVFALGLLMSQYTLTGYDASAHMTEETKNAAKAGPRGIVNSILVSLVAGLGAAARVDLRHPELLRRGDLVDRGAARADLHRRGWPENRRVPAADRHRRAVVLRHGLGDRELTDDLRVRPGRRHSWLAVVAQDQQAHPDANQLGVVRGRRRVHFVAALPVERDRVRGGHVDRDGRSVRGLRDPGVPAACCAATRSRRARGTSGSGAGRSASWRARGW